MKLDLQLYGIAVSATPAGATLLLNGTALRLSSAEFGALVHALGSIQEILSRATPTSGTLEPAYAVPVSTFDAPPAKKRGRPPKTEAGAGAPVAAHAVVPASTWVPGMPKKRGRPPKSSYAAAAPAAASAVAAPVTAWVPGMPKKRGRPPKSAYAASAVAVAPAAAVGGPRKRGRPPKIVAAAADAAVAPRKRGRPPKAVAAAAAEQTAPRKRGRPPKSAVAAVARQPAADADAGKRGPGRPRTDGTAVGAARLVDLVDAWMAANPGPKSMAELAVAAGELQWVEAAHAAEFLERHVPRAPHLFVRLPDGRFRRRADKTPVEAPKAAKVMRRRGHDEIAIVRVEAPGT